MSLAKKGENEEGRKKERKKERKTERQKDKKTKRQKDRKKEGKKERDLSFNGKTILFLNSKDDGNNNSSINIIKY